jgi:hypothetical protein
MVSGIPAEVTQPTTTPLGSLLDLTGDNVVKYVEMPPIQPPTGTLGTLAVLTAAPSNGTAVPPISQQPAPSTTAPTLVRLPEEPKRPLEIEDDAEAGALFLYGNFNLPNPLHFVTSQIHEGPLFDVIISTAEHRATIIFQRSSHAGNFLRRNEEMKVRSGFTLYGHSYTLTPGPVIPWDDQIRAMNYPFKERRRLTFARAGLFTSKLTPEQFKADMTSLVGQENLETAWVFNAGNGMY